METLYYDLDGHTVWRLSEVRDYHYWLVYEVFASVDPDFDRWLKSVIGSEFILFEDYLSKVWEGIHYHMDDRHRESIHRDIAPCSKTEFLMEYIKRFTDMDVVLDSEYSIDIRSLREGVLEE